MPRRRSPSALEAARSAPHPHAGLRWFEALPAERRAELERSYREGLRLDALLVRQSRRRVAGDVARTVAVFVLADQLLAPHGSAISGLAALATGAVLGVSCAVLNADRVVSGALGVATFFALQCLTRGGLSGLHMFVFMPVGAACVWLGQRREERGYDC